MQARSLIHERNTACAAAVRCSIGSSLSEWPFILDDLLVERCEALESFAVERAFAAYAFGSDELVALRGKGGWVDAEDDAAIAFEKAAPAIAGEARMTGHAHKAANGGGRAADVKHRVQHSGHRTRRTGTH